MKLVENPILLALLVGSLLFASCRGGAEPRTGTQGEAAANKPEDDRKQKEHILSETEPGLLAFGKELVDLFRRIVAVRKDNAEPLDARSYLTEAIRQWRKGDFVGGDTFLDSARKGSHCVDKWEELALACRKSCEIKIKKPREASPPRDEHMGDGKIKELEDDKEVEGEETERTKWKDDSQREKARKWQVRKGLILIPNSKHAKTARSALLGFKAAFGDPEAEREALGPLRGIGKDAVPAIANFMTKDINHKSVEGAMMGSILFNILQEKCCEHFKYGCEFQYGMFESSEEKWNAITEVKMMLLRNGYELEKKK